MVRPRTRELGWAARLGARARAHVRGMTAALSTILGVPSYARYRAHVQLAHPGEQPLSADEFHRKQLERRYNRVGGRCC